MTEEPCDIVWQYDDDLGEPYTGPQRAAVPNPDRPNNPAATCDATGQDRPILRADGTALLTEGGPVMSSRDGSPTP